jgi:two-component system LytT family response regulator
MKYIIIDDEMLGVEVLHQLLTEHCPQLKFSGKAYNADEGLDLINQINPDLVFLDIEMHDKNGFELLNQLKVVNFKVIFVTSYDQYAIKAIRFNAFDYLLKPVMVDELLACVKRAQEMGPTKLSDIHVQVNPEATKLCINQKTKLDYVNFTDIIYLKGDGNYTYIITSAGKENYTSRTLKEYDDLLCIPGSSFIRIHKSCIVNVQFVTSVIRSESMYVVLKNGEQLEVSRRKKNLLLEKLVQGS